MKEIRNDQSSSHLDPAFTIPTLVDLTPLSENDGPVFYPVDIDSALDQLESKPLHDSINQNKTLPPTPMSEPNGTAGTEFPELPPAPPSREYGHGYSASHPVPTVQSYKATKAENEEQARQYAEIVAKRQAEAEARARKAEEAKKLQESGPPQSGGEKPVAPGESTDIAEKTELHDEKNAVKANADKKDKNDPHSAANEKTRLMEQMNANKCES